MMQTSASNSNSSKFNTKLFTMNFEDIKSSLHDLIVDNCIIERDNILSNNQIEVLDFDLKNITLSSEGIFLASSALFNIIKPEINYVGGTYEDGYSLPANLALIAKVLGFQLDTFLIRDQVKQTSYSKLLDGSIEDNAKVCILVDVIRNTTDITKLINILTDDYNIKQVQVIALVDNSHNSYRTFKELGIYYNYIYRALDLRNAYLEKYPLESANLAKKEDSEDESSESKPKELISEDGIALPRERKFRPKNNSNKKNFRSKNNRNNNKRK